MARIDEDDFDTEAPTTEAAAVETSTEPEAAEAEGTPEGQATEGTEAPAEGTEAEATPSAEEEAAKKAAEAKAAAEEYERLFTAFKAAADSAVKAEDVDKDTGHLHEGLKAPVSLAYSAMPGAKGKNAAKTYLQEKMQQGMLDGVEDPAQYIVARSYLQLFKEVPKDAGAKPAGGDKPTVVVDPTEAFVARIAALLIAPNLTTVPEGVTDDWKDKAKAKAQELQGQVASYRNWLTANVGKSDEEKSAKPEVDAIVEAAAKVASGRAAGKAPRKAAAAGGTTTSAGSSYSGPRRNVVEHIRQAFEGHPVGTWLSNAEIAKFQSTEYGDDRPSSGAVSARLFKKDENDVFQPQELAEAGVRGEERDHKGAVKIA